MCITDKVQKVREEVEKRLEVMQYQVHRKDAYKELKSILNYIDSLQEELVNEKLEKEEFVDIEEIINEIDPDHKVCPITDLEGAANNALERMLDKYDLVGTGSCLEMFKLGAQWQKEQMLAKSIEGTARPDDGEIWCDLKSFNFKDGDKVKLIVIKED